MEVIKLCKHTLLIYVPHENIDSLSLSLLGHLSRSNDLSFWVHSKTDDVFLVFDEKRLISGLCVHTYAESSRCENGFALRRKFAAIASLVLQEKTTESEGLFQLQIAFWSLVEGLFRLVFELLGTHKLYLTGCAALCAFVFSFFAEHVVVVLLWHFWDVF